MLYATTKTWCSQVKKIFLKRPKVGSTSEKSRSEIESITWEPLIGQKIFIRT